MVQIGDVRYRPLDYAQILRDVEDIKGARTNRRVRENVMTRQDQMDEARRGFLQGRLGSMDDLITLSPDGAMKFMDAVDRMGQDERARAQESIENTGRMAAYVLQGETPEEQAQRYAAIRQSLPPDQAKMLPEEYDPNVVRLHLSRAMETSKLFDVMTAEDVATTTAGRAAGVRAEKRANVLSDTAQEREEEMADAAAKQKNVLAQIGAKGGEARETAAAKAAATATAKATAPPEGMTSAESNTISRLVGDLFGGLYDPQTGTFRNLSKDERPRAHKMKARAERIFLDARNSGRHLTPAEAVQQAKDEGGAKGGGDGDLASPKSKAEYDALPSGTRYTDPDGTVRVKS